MNNTVRKGLIAVLGLVFLVSIGTMIYRNIQLRESQDAYDSAEEIAETEEPEEEIVPEEEPVPEEPVGWREAPVYDDPYMDELQKTDLAALRETNEDVIGWISIPDTPVLYPLMYSGDNDYYLKHTWDKQPNEAGSIFLEQYNQPDLSDFNTIVYGHRMRNNSMFGSLKYYVEQEYWEEHPYIYIFDDNGAHRYEIFSAYEASVTGKTYRLELNETEDRQSFLDACIGWSVIDTGVVPTVNDRILTLSTCTGRGYETRWVVQACLFAAVD